MRRYLAFAVLFAFSLPIGLSITGCGHNPANYCIKNGHAYGVTTSQVTSIILQPETTGVSLSWGQTYQAGPAQAYNCLGGTETVAKYTYTSSNLLLGDISPAGTICAGTWNRNSEGGVPNFTICTPPAGSSISSFNGCTSTSCGIVQVTADGGGATSNPVDVYIHPPVTSVTIGSQGKCVSQGQTLEDSNGNPLSFLEETTVQGPGGAILCSPNPGTIACTSPLANIGTILYGAQTPDIVTINNTTNPQNPNPVTGPTTAASTANGVATANLPGSTIINASLSNSNVSSAAGYFSTCPPATITLSVNGSTTATVTPNSPQTAVASAVDINGNAINGLTLNFASTEPQNLSVSSAGLVSSTFPSHATVTAVCSPPNCNPAPVNLVGTLGNGMPVTANPITINSPGRASNQIWMASPQSDYFSEIDLSTGGTAVPVPLPYPPNSMVMDQAGINLYFGSYHELMIYSAGNNTLSKEVPTVPGVVLAISPTNNLMVINDQLRQVIYLFNPTSEAVVTTFAGIANRAQFTPDGSTVYIAGVNPANGDNTLFVYNVATGWSTYPLNYEPTYNCQLDAAGTAAVPAYNSSYDPFCGPSVTLTVPDVAAFLSGTTTVANSDCPNSSATPPYYPPAGEVPVPTTQIEATADGDHILGADPTTFTDIWLYPTSTLSGNPGVPVNACPGYNNPALTMNTSADQTALPGSVTSTTPEIDQVVSSPYSDLAFVMYQPCTDPGATCPSGSTPPTSPPAATGVLPYYVPASSAASPMPGTLAPLQLSGGAQAPVAGIFSPDGSLFFVSTSGDNLIHEVNTTTACTTSTGTTPFPCDSGVTLDPKLINGVGQAIPAKFLVVKSRSTT